MVKIRMRLGYVLWSLMYTSSNRSWLRIPITPSDFCHQLSLRYSIFRVAGCTSFTISHNKCIYQKYHSTGLSCAQFSLNVHVILTPSRLLVRWLPVNRALLQPYFFNRTLIWTLKTMFYVVESIKVVQTLLKASSWHEWKGEKRTSCNEQCHDTSG